MIYRVIERCSTRTFFVFNYPNHLFEDGGKRISGWNVKSLHSSLKNVCNRVRFHLGG